MLQDLDSRPAPSKRQERGRGTARHPHGLLRPRGSERVAVFAHDPGLVADLDDTEARRLTAIAQAPLLHLPVGPWEPPRNTTLQRGLGLLVLEGAMVRSLLVGGRLGPEIVARGDLVRPWDHVDEGDSIPAETSWRVIAPTAVAVLGPRFASLLAAFPSVMSRVLARGSTRARTLALCLGATQIRHAETRLLVLLWHLADRWGTMTRDGARIELPLTHELLAQLVGLQRPSASTALKRLESAGEVGRTPDGGWLLCGQPPEEAVTWPPSTPAG